MIYADKLTTPGEHKLMLTGACGQIEAVLAVPEQLNSAYAAVIGHPHSLQGGTMTNKVVTTMVRAFKELGIPSLRFNFRGVGLSAGSYDAGIGESDDMLSLVQLWQAEQPQLAFFFAGFSFGSYVAYRAAAQYPHQMLITIAPPVHHYDYKAFAPVPGSWLIAMGDADEVVPANLVLDFALEHDPQLTVIPFVDTGHFFHGKLLDLKAELIAAISLKVTKA
ncbi:MAG: alpha/beta hydrolase [Legionella sp.]